MRDLARVFKVLGVLSLFLLAVGTGGSVSAPSASFVMAPMNPAANSPVQFTDTSAGATSWSWNFGDGTTSTVQSPAHTYAAGGTYMVTLTVGGMSGSSTANQMVAVTPEGTLRLNGAHSFDITLSARDPRTGGTGVGKALPQNDIYGIFSIPTLTFNAANPEVIVKIVDASGIGQNYWVFYSALTDLQYTLTVKENATGVTKTYQNQQVGTTVCGQFDTSGFLLTATPTPPGATPTPPAATSTPTRTPTSPGLTTVSLVATRFQWDFSGGTTSGCTNQSRCNFTMRVGQPYQLMISDGDPNGIAHGFSGISSLGIPAQNLTIGGAPRIVNFTPSSGQVGTHGFSCNQTSCGIGHGDMLGTIQITP